jgi:putative transposase
MVLFGSPADYELFCAILAEAVRRFHVCLLAYALMPNHWHLVVRPLDDRSLSAFMQWLEGTHAKRWRKAKGSRGRGAVYQSRFKAIAVQHDRHFLRLCRYVERNAVRAKLVARAEDWPWCSGAPTASLAGRPELSPWPVPKPENWDDWLNTPEPPRSLQVVRAAIRAGRHYGTPSWRLSTAESLRWQSGLRQPGRPIVPAREEEAESGMTIL